MMRLKLIGTAALAMIAASSAQAVTFVSATGAPDPGPATGEAILVNFDDPLPAGYELLGSFGITSGTTAAAAAPANDTTDYFYVSSALGAGTATLTTAFDLETASFYWGSVDAFNQVEVLGAGGVTLLTIDGSDLPTFDGNQTAATSNRRVFFTAGANEVITGFRFTSTGVAFEIDDVAGAADDGTGVTVPEPATWAMMLVGFGLIGASARRRKVKAVLS